MIKVEPHETRTLKWWFEQYRQERLDMAPPYQRRSYIWGRWKQAHLIDSIMNGYDIPKFYVANFFAMPSRTLNSKKRPYAIIDGKQRLQAIFDFFADDLKLNSTTSLLEYPAAQVAGLKFSALKAGYPHLAALVEDFVPAVMNVITDSELLINEMFVRLNSGEAVTGAERRNAMPGPVPALIRELVLHPFFERKIRFGTKRMQDSNLAAKLLLFEFRNSFADTKARNLDEFAKAAARELTISEGKKSASTESDPGDYGKARDRVFRVLDRLNRCFNDSDPLLAAQGHIPVYYWVARQEKDLLPWFRPFLQEFTKAVSDNLKVARDRPDAADAELSSYYTQGRTTNDQASLEGRYRILVRRLKRFVAKHPDAKR